jgi:putative phosphoesterase
MVLGILADTQIPFTPCQMMALKKAFKGVQLILHAGPLGNLKILDQLSNIAPTQAVCGNAENSIIRSELFIRQSWTLGKVKLGLIHGYGKPQNLKSWLIKQFENNPVQIIVYGRNFEPTAKQLGSIYFFSPGSFLGNLPEGQHGRRGPSRVGLLFIHGTKVDGIPGIVLS